MKLAQIVPLELPPHEGHEQQLDLAALQPKVETVVVFTDSRGRASFLDGDRLAAGQRPANRRVGRPRSLGEVLLATGATIAHLYGRSLLSTRLLARIPIPVVAAASAPPSRIPWRRVRQPDAILGEAAIPPAVAPGYFQSALPRKDGTRVGALVRDAAGTRAIGSARQRIERFRDDIQWSVMRTVPEPAEMHLLDAWIDPTPELGAGGVPEAMAAGVSVIAARTPAALELLDGDAGFLTPPGDANELAHAVLAALFKPEVALPKRRRAAELAERFRLERRAEALLQVYRELSP